MQSSNKEMVWKNRRIGIIVTEGEREKRVMQNHLQRWTESIRPRQVTETGAIPFRMWGCEALNSMDLGHETIKKRG